MRAPNICSVWLLSIAVGGSESYDGSCLSKDGGEDAKAACLTNSFRH